jgi:hypothetical protein
MIGRNKFSHFWLIPALLIAVLVVPAWAESARFTVDSKGAILDSSTGLMWQKTDSYLDGKKGMNWYQALEYVDGKNSEKFGGYNDWRLPTLEELKKIWDAKRPVESKDGDPIGLPEVFASGGSYYLWTGTERNLDNAWYFGLGQREDYWNLKDLGDLDQGVKMVRKAR